VSIISTRDRSFQPLAEIEGELVRRMLPEPSEAGVLHAEDAFASA
jgi:hypothetical protein